MTDYLPEKRPCHEPYKAGHPILFFGHDRLRASRWRDVSGANIGSDKLRGETICRYCDSEIALGAGWLKRDVWRKVKRKRALSTSRKRSLTDIEKTVLAARAAAVARLGSVDHLADDQA